MKSSVYCNVLTDERRAAIFEWKLRLISVACYLCGCVCAHRSPFMAPRPVNLDSEEECLLKRSLEVAYI